MRDASPIGMDARVVVAGVVMAVMAACTREEPRGYAAAPVPPVTQSEPFPLGPEERDEAEPPERVPVSGRVLPFDEAADTLARVQCEREERCERIGTNEPYSSKAACLSALRVHAIDAFGDCAGGVDADSLDDCVEEIRAESCIKTEDPFDRSLPCKTAALCLDERVED
jgi:hypothetical protein